MSDAPIDTIDRTRAARDLHKPLLSPNLLINGGFQQVQWADINPDFGWTSAEHLRVPGWFPFGATGGPAPHVELSIPGTGGLPPVHTVDELQSAAWLVRDHWLEVADQAVTK